MYTCHNDKNKVLIELLLKWEYFGVSQLNPWVQTYLKLKLVLHYLMVMINIVTCIKHDVRPIFAMHHEAITKKVCLYPWITWGKPIFAMFLITTINL